MNYKKRYVPNHPYAMKCGCVYEHRLVMEQEMGRYLLPHEQVHHQDEDKGNNDISNLFFCPTQKDHSAEHAFTEDELLDLLVRYSDVFGSLPSRRQCDRHPEMPHSSTYIRHFNSWSEAKNLALQHIYRMNEPEEELYAEVF